MREGFIILSGLIIKAYLLYLCFKFKKNKTKAIVYDYSFFI